MIKLLGTHFGNVDWFQIAPKDIYLSCKSIRITTLDRKNTLLRNATGFLIQHEDGIYIYTCWHVVTEIDFLNPQTPRDRPRPHSLRLTGMNAIEDSTGISIGGKISFDVSLYDSNNVPVWEQATSLSHRVDADLNGIGIFVPQSLDVIRLKVNIPEHIATLWSLRSDRDIDHSFQPKAWNTVILSGYPYGYSPVEKAITPINLKRMIASSYSNTVHDTLLDGTGVSGMSGCPVYSESLGLIGIYRGAIFPDYKALESNNNSNDKFAALGLMTMYLHLGIAFSTLKSR